MSYGLFKMLPKNYSFTNHIYIYIYDKDWIPINRSRNEDRSRWLMSRITRKLTLLRFSLPIFHSLSLDFKLIPLFLSSTLLPTFSMDLYKNEDLKKKKIIRFCDVQYGKQFLHLLFFFILLLSSHLKIHWRLTIWKEEKSSHQ